MPAQERQRLAKYAVIGLGTVSVLYLAWRLGLAGGKQQQRTDSPGWERSRALIGKLDQAIQPMAWRVLADAWDKGISLVVTQSARTMAEQQALYDQGRTTPGKIVTKAPPGSSWHNFALAFDVAVLEGTTPTWPNDLALWSKIGDIGKAVGLQWGGDWSGFPDRPHFEFHPGMTLADARAGKRPTIA